MSETFLFVDETGDPLILNKQGSKTTKKDTDGPKSFFVGILITHNPYEIREVVHNAFVNLRNNAINDKDMRTIERGYFHAAEDSHLAKITLAEKLSKCNFSIKITEYDKDIFPITNSRAKKQREFHVQALLTTLIPLLFVYEKIIIVVAERFKSMTYSVIQDIINKLQNYYELSLKETSNLNYKNIQESISISIESDMTKEPILQAIDLVLWANNRRLNKNDNTYFNCLKMIPSTAFKPRGELEYLRGYDFFVGKDVYFEDYENYISLCTYSNKNEMHKIISKLKEIIEILETPTSEDMQLKKLLYKLYSNGLNNNDMNSFLLLWSKRIDYWPIKMNFSQEEYNTIKNKGALACAAMNGELTPIESLDLIRWTDYLRKIVKRKTE